MHQTLKTVFQYISKHLKVCQKYSAPYLIFNSLLGTQLYIVCSTLFSVLSSISYFQLSSRYPASYHTFNFLLGTQLHIIFSTFFSVPSSISYFQLFSRYSAPYHTVFSTLFSVLSSISYFQLSSWCLKIWSNTVFRGTKR